MKRTIYPDYVACDICGFLKPCRLDRKARKFVCAACDKKGKGD